MYAQGLSGYRTFHCRFRTAGSLSTMGRTVVGYHQWPRTLTQGRDGIKGIHQFGHFIAIFTGNPRSLHSDKAGNAHCRWRGEGGSYIDQVTTICYPPTTPSWSAISSPQASPSLGFEVWLDWPGGWTASCPNEVGCVAVGVVDVLGVDLVCCDWDCGTVLRMVRVAGMTVVKVLVVGLTGIVEPGLTGVIWENTCGTPTVGLTNCVPGAFERETEKSTKSWSMSSPTIYSLAFTRKY